MERITHTHPDYAALERMFNSDPAGWEGRRPTEKDYESFRDWAINTFGAKLWQRYCKGAWRGL